MNSTFTPIGVADSRTRRFRVDCASTKIIQEPDDFGHCISQPRYMKSKIEEIEDFRKSKICEVERLKKSKILGSRSYMKSNIYEVDDI
jgi:hypothetical protein